MRSCLTNSIVPCEQQSTHLAGIKTWNMPVIIFNWMGLMAVTKSVYFWGNCRGTDPTWPCHSRAARGGRRQRGAPWLCGARATDASLALPTCWDESPIGQGQQRRGGGLPRRTQGAGSGHVGQREMRRGAGRCSPAWGLEVPTVLWKMQITADNLPLCWGRGGPDPISGVTLIPGETGRLVKPFFSGWNRHCEILKLNDRTSSPGHG